MTVTAKEFRLVVVGPPVVGKSALTIRLTQSEFANEYDPTIEDSYRYYTKINGEQVSLDILDTAGQEEYSSMRDMYMKTGEGFILVFSLTDRQTFDEIATFYRQIMRVKGEQVDFVPMMLVGNKSDLEEERQVSKEEGLALAKRFDCAYIETSAKSGINVSNAFHGVVKMIIGNSVLGVGLENTLYPNEDDEAIALAQAQAQERARAQAEGHLNAQNVANGDLNDGAKSGDNKATKGKSNQQSKPSGGDEGGCCVIM
ncbi:Ras family GTPase [Martiniozyma asiatica (nom. inval.)]|nr:Ras family GTPase [Martiniozyma asiatica]